MSRPSLLRSAPYFPVADVAATAAYYASTLGFATEYIAGAPPIFAICTRDGFSVMLRRVDRPMAIAPMESQGGSWDAFFWVRDAQALCGELRGAGATVVYGPVRQPAYNMLEFAVRDPDGHVLGFGQAV